MSNETIRKGLIDAINALTLLHEVCDSNQEFTLRLKISDLFHQLDRVLMMAVIVEEAELNAAITSIKEVTEMAKEAEYALDKVTETITKAEEVASRLDHLIGGVDKS